MFADIVKIGCVDGSGNHYINRTKIRTITSLDASFAVVIVFDNGVSERFTFPSIELMNTAIVMLVNGKE